MRLAPCFAPTIQPRHWLAKCSPKYLCVSPFLLGLYSPQSQVNSQVQRLRDMMDAMPIAAWDVHAAIIPFQASRSLRWSSDWDLAYLGPSGQVFHHCNPGTYEVVLTFEIQYPARFTFQYTLDPQDGYLNPDQLQQVVKEMVYID